MSVSANLDLVIPLNEISKDAKYFQVTVNDAERAALVERFKIRSLDNLSCDISVETDLEREGIAVKGHLKATLVQQCIVTLGDVPEMVDESFELLLVSPEQAARFDEDELYADPEAPDYDAFEGESVPLGEIVAQTLSVMMNPYPRVAGAEIKPIAGSNFSVNEELEKKPNPFAALAELRDKS